MTAQVGDVIHYKGERLALFDNPLESLWDDSNPRPKFVPYSTANWRGYVATWTISDEILYLEGISGVIIAPEDGQLIQSRTPLMQQGISDGIRGKRSTVPVTVEMLFPKSKGHVAATWFTGRLRIPRGALLHYVHMGYASVYEEEIMLEIESGRVVHTEVIDNRGKSHNVI